MGFRLARDSRLVLVPELGLLAVASLASMAFPALAYLAYGVFLFFVFSLYFFRDPERRITEHKNAVLSPVDGKVLSVEGSRITIFLSPFDVHVSRAPVAGRVSRIKYFPGKFLPAFLKGAGENERELMEFEGRLGKIVVIRIAGILARRIVTWVKPGDAVSAGDRVGMIRFGSRCEIALPKRLRVTVSRGMQLYGGITVIARRSA